MNGEEASNLVRIMGEVMDEVDRASKLHGPFPTLHHGYAVLLEEVDELWDGIKKNDKVNTREEAIQVAAMAIRFVMDLKL